MAPDYLFRPMAVSDLPLIRRWLALPHVREWWGDPQQQYTLVSGDLDEPAMDQYIFSTAGGPFAYLQCYDLTAWNSGFGPHPLGTRGIANEVTVRRWFVGSSMIGCKKAPRASSRILTQPMVARSVPIRKQDLKRTAW